METDDKIWQSIADEIGRISPEIHKTLSPSVEASQIDDFEKRFQVRLPEAFKSYLRVFNGQTNDGKNFPIVGYNRFLPLHEMSRTIVQQIELFGHHPPLKHIKENKIRPVLWDPLWIPFAECDDSGRLILDSNAGRNGRNGQVILLYPGVDMESDELVVSVSFDDFGKELLRRLENNEFEIDEDDSSIQFTDEWIV